MKVPRKAFVVLGLLSLALIFSRSAAAAMKLRMGIASLTNEYIAVWVAKELSRFKEQGIDLDLITFSGVSTMLQAMLAGELNTVFVGGVFVQAGLRGTDLVTVATPIDTFPYQLVVKSSIRRPEQLEGRKLGISRFGSASEIGLRMSLKKVGLDAEKSRVTIMQVGGQTDRFTALRSGVVDGSLFAAPFTGRPGSSASTCFWM
jgi:NitT/TauT family transport system substrate-binding protein